MNQRSAVQDIIDLPWSLIRDEDQLMALMLLSQASAVEFAEALRMTQARFPDNSSLAEMAHGELATTNLAFDDYNERGDHWQFLQHFCRRIPTQVLEKTARLTLWYTETCRNLSADVRISSILSREQHLPEVFRKILLAPAFSKSDEPILAFKYYLERHIELDTAPGSGHHDLTKGIELPGDPEVFWRIRLEFYQQFFAIQW